MIIIGYPGIGKSSYARFKGGRHTIDLESSCFVKDDNWAVSYCNVAVDLAKQGFDVFVSSHDAVRKALMASGYDRIFAVYPSLCIKKDWISRLEARYKRTRLEKDLRSLERARAYYEVDITALKNDAMKLRGFYEIHNYDYELGDAVEQFYDTCGILI